MAITYHDYWSEIDRIVGDVKKAVREGADMHDTVHESVDDHEYIIYTAKAASVLIHSSNEDALFIESGSTSFDSYDDAMTRMAFWAMQQDVYDKLGGWMPEAKNEDDAGEEDGKGEEDDDADTVRVPSKVSAEAVEFHAAIVRHNLDGLIANWIAAQPEGEDTARHLWKSVDTDAHEDWSHGNYRLSALPAHPNDDGGWVYFGVALAPNAEEGDAGEE